MKIGNPFRRQAPKTVPGACYDECNDALLEAESTGKSPTFCDDSAFLAGVTACSHCIEAHTNSTVDFDTVILPKFQQFISFCANVSSANNTFYTSVDYVLAKESSILAAKSSLSVSQSSLDAQLSSLGYKAPTTTLLNESISSTASSTLQISAITVSVPISTSTLTSTPFPSPRAKTGTTIGAVTSIIGIIIICLAIYLFLKNKRKGKTKRAACDYAEKPELHADDLKPIYSELDGSMTLNHPRHHAAELPAREIVGAELNAESIP